MRMLIALMLLICSFASSPPPIHQFIVFTHDGTFYKLDPQTKEVQWHNELPFKLLSLNINNQHLQNNTQKLFIPTIDGDFLYLENSLFSKQPKQILVPREDVEHLLDMCFDSHSEQKYFVYQKHEYFVLNTQNGQFFHLEDYLNQGLIFNKGVHAIIIVAKKLLKQLSLNMKVKWSIISSKITLTNVDDFIKNSNGKIDQIHLHHTKYSFLRIDPKTIQILDQYKNVVFQIQASSSIMNVFCEDKSTHQYSKMLIKNTEQKMLALAAGRKNNSVKNGLSNEERKMQNQFDSFPLTDQFLTKDENQHKQDPNYLQMCIKTHKILKEANIASSQARIFGQKPKILFGDKPNQYNFSFQDFNPEDLPTLPYSSDKRIHVIVTKEQPFVYIFLIIIILGGGFMFYRFKVNKLLEHISQVESITDENLKKFNAKLGQYENVGKQLKKMYQINWQNILYKNSLYFVFEGRFLNQTAQVFVLPLSGFDIIDIQHKLNLLINCSHKSTTKLYYYTRNDDSLLIFCQKNPTYRRLNQLKDWQEEIYGKLSKDQQGYKNCIKILLDSLFQLINMKIQVNSFTEQSILLNQKSQIKVNIISSFLNKNFEQEDKRLREMGTTKLRVDLIKAIHKMGHKGTQFDLVTFQKQKNSVNQQNSFLKDFYDHFLLTQYNPEQLEAIKHSQKHPFLWDSKQKMLYVCDFSNYIETCIDEQKISKMETHCRNFQIIPLPWNSLLHPTLARQINNYRKYDFNSVRDLIRLIRNKLSHFHEIPKQTRAITGKTPQQFVQHFLQKYPKLLSFMYAYATKKKWKLTSAH